MSLNAEFIAHWDISHLVCSIRDISPKPPSPYSQEMWKSTRKSIYFCLFTSSLHQYVNELLLSRLSTKKETLLSFTLLCVAVKRSCLTPPLCQKIITSKIDKHDIMRCACIPLHLTRLHSGAVTSKLSWAKGQNFLWGMKEGSWNVLIHFLTIF